MTPLASRRAQEGSALIVTLMVALVLFIGVFAITTTLSLNNRRTAGNQTVAVRAQFNAETGLNRALQQVGVVQSALRLASPSTITSTTLLAFQQNLYRFCYGDPSSPPAGAPTFAAFQASYNEINSQQSSVRSATVTLCDASGTGTAHLVPINAGDADQVVGASRMQLFVESVPDNAYGSTLTAAQEQQFWGRYAKGLTLDQSLNTEGDRFATTLTYAPLRLVREGINFRLDLGNPADPDRTILSVGSIAAANSSTVAQRVVSQNVTLSLLLNQPTFTQSLAFINTQFATSNNNRRVTFGDGTRFNGPIRTNSNFAFTSGANVVFGGATSSSGCWDGAGLSGSSTVCVGNNGVRNIGYNIGGTVPADFKNLAATPNKDQDFDGVNLDTRKRDTNYDLMCGPNGNENTCGTGDTNYSRQVVWNADPVAMPTDAIVNFTNLATAGGFRFTPFNAADDSGAWNAMLSAGDGNRRIRLATRPGSLAATASWIPSGSRPDAYVQGVSTSASAWPPVPEELRSRIGKIDGTPTVVVSVDANGNQILTVSARIIRGWRPRVVANCSNPSPSTGGGGGGTPPPPGNPEASVPSLRQVVGSVPNALRGAWTLLTSGSTASAQVPGTAWPTCPTTGNTRLDSVDLQWDPVYANDLLASGATGTSGNDGASLVTEQYRVNNAGYTINGRVDLVSTNYPSINGATPNLYGQRTAVTGATLDPTVARPVTLPDGVSVAPTATSASNLFDFNGTVIAGSDTGLNGGSRALSLTVQSNPRSGTPTEAQRRSPEIARSTQMTLVANGTVTLDGELDYTEDPNTNPNARNLLGVYARDNININPLVRNSTTQMRDLTYDAVLFAQNGSITMNSIGGSVQSNGTTSACDTGTVNKGTINFTGSLIQNRLGAMRCRSGTSQYGYTPSYVYDRRLATGLTPPGFPTNTSDNWTPQTSIIGDQFLRVQPGY